MAAAIPVIASVGAGIIASKLTQPKQQAMPSVPQAPAMPSAADIARQNAEAAQTAAAIARKRSSAVPYGSPTILTGPRGLTTPAPVQRGTTLGS